MPLLSRPDWRLSWPAGVSRPGLPVPLSPVKKREHLREWLIGLGWAHVSLAWITFLMGSIAIASKHGTLELLAILSPVNLRSWAVTVLAFAPGVLLLMFGYRLGSLWRR